MDKWEYKVIDLNPLDYFFPRKFEEYGEDGWELVLCIRYTIDDYDRDGKYTFIFKRKK